MSYIKKLDVQEIKEDFRRFLGAQEEFSDFDMTQSGIDQLLTLMAYGIHYDSLQANVSNTEMFLSTAQLRKSVVARAKHLMYTPKSKISASAIIDVIVEERNGVNLPSTLFLPKGTQFAVAQDLAESFFFVTRESYVAEKVGTIFRFEDVKIYEGSYNNVYQRWMGDKLSIPSRNVDIDSVQVFVREDPNSTIYTEYNRTTSIVDLTGESQVFYLEEFYDSNYGIYFGDGILGKFVPNRSDILITFIETKGSEGNKLNSFSFVKTPDKTDPINQGQIRTITKEASSGGSEQESIESIKFNAPKFFSSQGMILNDFDANYIIPTLYPDIKSVNLWSGKGADSFGRTYISLNPYLDNLTQNRIDEILEDVERRRSVVLTDLVYVPPVYLDLEIRLNLFLDGVQSITSTESALYSRIIKFSEDNIEDYMKNFISSKFIKYVTSDVDQYDFSLGIISRLIVYPNSLESYQFNFYNEISSLKTNEFIFQGSTAYIESFGSTLRIVSTTDGSILRRNAGTVDLQTGKGIISNLNIQAIEDNTLVITAEPKRESIFSKDNAICRILEKDIKLTYELPRRT